MTTLNKPIAAISKEVAPNDEKYRQKADYYQLADPVNHSIKDLDLKCFIDFVCEEYRYRKELKRRREWREAPGRHVSQGMLWEYSGRAIYKYVAHEIQLVLNALCVEGSDSDSLTLRFGGEDTLRNLRAYQREKKPLGMLGADQFRHLIEKHRSHLRELWFAKYEAGKKLVATPRLYLADKLNHSSKIVKIDLQKAVEHQAKAKYWTPTQSLTPPATLGEYRAYQAGLMSWSAHELGQLLGNIDYFNRCWREFHEAEQAPTAALVSGELSLRQVALLYHYQGKVMPKAADSIAQHYGHQSGAKLYGHSLKVTQTAGRIGEDMVGQKLAPMIKDITMIIPHLSEAEKEPAERELQTLQARKETPV